MSLNYELQRHKRVLYDVRANLCIEEIIQKLFLPHEHNCKSSFDTVFAFRNSAFQLINLQVLRQNRRLYKNKNINL